MSDSIPRVEAALERLGAEHAPPRGWETRVLAAIQERPSQVRWWFALQVVSLAAIALIFWPSSKKPSNDNLALDVILNPVGPTVRGSSAHLGDRVHVTAASRDRYRAIWVYHDDRELVAACPERPSCRRSGETTTLDVTLEAVGSYRFVAVTSASPLPEPRGSCDHDRAAAEEVGATVKTHALDVR